MCDHESFEAVLMVFGLRVGDGPVLGLVQVNRGMWEVRKSPGVISVQVREHDVTDVGWCVSEPYHLLYRGLVWVQNGFGEGQEEISE